MVIYISEKSIWWTKTSFIVLRVCKSRTILEERLSEWFKLTHYVETLQQGYDDIIDLLNSRHGTTALILATKNGVYDTVAFLLDHDADLEAIDKEGKTAFDYAIENAAKDGYGDDILNMLNFRHKYPGFWQYFAINCQFIYDWMRSVIPERFLKIFWIENIKRLKDLSQQAIDEGQNSLPNLHSNRKDLLKFAPETFNIFSTAGHRPRQL